ncbi:Phosphate-specific transport system accessory protein PhoU [Koleobacter methoxysyntrophicus]|uniref:Phosphate-specific transport system accessory protein PhoU n=1 Tax=Koleobacter methoxysyntrophicus TaxID=2751313 RepID=A0A8A0RKY5_9FIRM|nr:phosphate signaling complex protein PhoU [Koleobacter methoxysyntrophicus]QSQ08384.1 Phosphate-specific transport system accessory protein PhoU [Koleobacter methoxysyntrophicus]
MTSTMRSGFQRELDELYQDVLKMGSIVEQQIFNAVESLKNKDKELAEKVIKDDDIVDNLETSIEDKCIKLIARQQPIAKDLRIIFTGIKIVTDLERMSDYATDIAKFTIRLLGEKYVKPLIDIPRMSEKTRKMVKDALDAYVHEDTELARQVCADDDEIDHLYKQIFNELLIIMMQDPRTIKQATQLLFSARALERIADHATNLGEWVIFQVTGKKKDLNA